jgi:hypothetical protein
MFGVAHFEIALKLGANMYRVKHWLLPKISNRFKRFPTLGYSSAIKMCCDSDAASRRQDHWIMAARIS